MSKTGPFLGEIWDPDSLAPAVFRRIHSGGTDFADRGGTEIILILHRNVHRAALHALRPVGPAQRAPRLSTVPLIGQKGLFAQGHRFIIKSFNEASLES